MKCSNCKTLDAVLKIEIGKNTYFYCQTCYDDLVQKITENGDEDKIHYDKSDDLYIVCPVCDGGLFYLPVSGGKECDNCGYIIQDE